MLLLTERDLFPVLLPGFILYSRREGRETGWKEEEEKVESAQLIIFFLKAQMEAKKKSWLLLQTVCSLFFLII